MTALFRGVVVLLTVSYPLAVYFGLQYFEPKIIGLVIALLFILRMFVLRNKLGALSRRQLYPVFILGFACAMIAGVLNEQSYLKLIPVLINMAFLVCFAYTLKWPPSMVERIARMTEPDLPQAAIAYTRTVTIVWCLFFIVNGSAALYTALFSSLEIWTLYNGLISYLLMGLLFAVEYLVREQVKKT